MKITNGIILIVFVLLNIQLVLIMLLIVNEYSNNTNGILQIVYI